MVRGGAACRPDGELELRGTHLMRIVQAELLGEFVDGVILMLIAHSIVLLQARWGLVDRAGRVDLSIAHLFADEKDCQGTQQLERRFALPVLIRLALLGKLERRCWLPILDLQPEARICQPPSLMGL